MYLEPVLSGLFVDHFVNPNSTTNIFLSKEIHSRLRLPIAFGNYIKTRS